MMRDLHKTEALQRVAADSCICRGPRQSPGTRIAGQQNAPLRAYVGVEDDAAFVARACDPTITKSFIGPRLRNPILNLAAPSACARLPARSLSCFVAGPHGARPKRGSNVLSP